MIEHPWHTIYGQPPAKSNTYEIVYISGHASLKKKGVTKHYEESFYLQAGVYKNLFIEGFFELHIRCYFTSKAHDLDNALKSVLDSLQKVQAIKNDNNCTRIVADKFIDSKNPRIEFRLIEI